MAECVQPGCDGYRKSKLGYCEAHLKRHIRGADMDTPIKRYSKWKKECSQPDCGRQMKSVGLCAAHYTQYVRGYDMTTVRVRSIHDPVCYESAHQRAKSKWGPPSRYTCIECDAQAHAWAYDGTDQTELMGGPVSGGRGGICMYSRYPEFYMPMCRRCHNARDKAQQQRELREYREWKMRVGYEIEALVKETP